jgi:Ricin-type beta-trefoil lectin domain
MPIRPFVIAALLGFLPSWLAAAEEPVVRGSFHSILVLGDKCLTVPQNVPRLRPGTRVSLRGCQNHPDQIFEWNVDTFEIKFHNLCLDAFRADKGQSRAGDPVGLWYCQKTKNQKWFPHQKNKKWENAFNIVGGGSPNSDLCLSIADGNDAKRAQLTLQNCNDSHNQWFRLSSWPSHNPRPVARRDKPISLTAKPATNAPR